MKPNFEKIAIAEGQSYALLNRRLDQDIPFEWHYHREYELTLTLNSHGQRFVGDHVGPYGDGDLVLLGPNLPHTWASSGRVRDGGPHVALVVQFRPEWIDGLLAALPELAPVRALLARSGRGLRFSDAMAARVRPAIEHAVDFAQPRRLLALLDVLLTLSTDAEAAPLASPNRQQSPFAEPDRPRIERVLDHIHAHYAERLSIDALAELAHLSASGLHRLFLRHTRMTVLDYIIQLRLGRACQLLMSSQRPIALIAADVGYENLSNFNRQFRAAKGATPREFRRQVARAAA